MFHRRMETTTNFCGLLKQACKMDEVRLGHGVTKKPNTGRDCAAVIGGMDYDYFKRCTVNANEFFMHNMNESGDLGVLVGHICVCKRVCYH